MSLPRLVIESLKIYDMKFDRRSGYWASATLEVHEEQLARLKPFEVDQVLAAIRDGRVQVSLGPNKTFRLGR